MNGQESQSDVKDGYVDELIERLMNHYLTNKPVPGNTYTELTPRLLHSLCRAIMAEGYGK